jgi:uncharacterized repeat protein (TIGR02543 family)
MGIALLLPRLKSRSFNLIACLATVVMLVGLQTFTPTNASANTATISDGSGNCQIAVTSATVTIDTSSASITLVGSRCVVQFLTVGSYTVTMPGGVASLDYLVVGGGGGGGSGGGGAGGVLQGTNYAVTAGTNYSVSVGEGGAGGRGGANGGSAPNSTNGGQSVFATITSLGGGAGGEGSHSPDHAGNGGSGGGSRYDCTNVITCIGTGTPGQGTNGAASTHGGYGGGAGGGGAGGAGGNTILYHIGGKGGDGVQSSITGTPQYFGGGGGGGINSNDNSYCGLNSPGTSDANYYCNGTTPVTTGGGLGGLGGGGRGSSWGYTGGATGDISVGGRANGTAGTPNTGGGGGGTDPEDQYAYAGGSGIVVLSYVSPSNFRLVTFDANNGSGSTSTQWVQSGVDTALQTNPYTYTGYVFQGWNTAANGSGTSYTNLANINTTTALTLYAQWRAGVTHTVAFNANGGSGSLADQIAGQATNLNANSLTRSGYTFSGWNTAANGSGYSYLDQAVYSFTQDATLYAQWTIIVVSHTVNFYGNGATSGTTSSQTASSTQAFNLNGFSRTGYNFLGWDTNNAAGSATYKDGQNYSFSADLSLYAIWVLQAPNVITFNGNGSTSGTMATETASSSTVLNANAFVRDGYTFLYWNTAANGSGVNYQSSYTYSFAASITLYAIWGQNFSVVYNGNTNDSGSAPGTQTSYVGGAPLTLQTNTGILAKSGYLFAGWNTSPNGSGTSYALGQTNTTLAGGVTLYAQWLGATYVVLYTSNNGTSGTAPSSQSYTYGTAGITLRSNTGTLARTGYTFAGWNTSPDGTGTAFVVSQANVTFSQDTVLFAQWTANQTTVTYVYNSADGGNAISAAVYSTGGSALVLPTPTRVGYAFGGWYSESGLAASVGSGGASYSPSTSSPALSIYAKWTANVYSVTYSYNGATGSASTPSASFTTGGTVITLPSPTKNGYNFDAWYSDSGFTTSIGGAGTAYSPNSVSTSITAYAKWLAKTYSLTYHYNAATGGASISSESFTSGGTAITLPTPTKIGYTFAGWYGESAFTNSIGSAGSSYSPSSNGTTLDAYAKWNANTYTVNYNYNGADYSSSAVSSENFTTGNSALQLPTTIRTHFHFDGWFDALNGGNLVGAAASSFTPVANKNLYARWTQDSLYGIGSNTKIGSLTVANGLGTEYTATGNSNSVRVNLPGGSLPDGTALDVYLLNDPSSVQSRISGPNNFLVSLVVSWLAADGTVPSTNVGKPVTVTISNPAIKAGAAIYRLIGGVAELVGTATQDGVAEVSLTDDPELVIAATAPQAPSAPQVTVSGTSATVSWVAPASSGGSDITSYLVTSSSGQTCTSSSLNCTVSGLTFGTPITFTVQAINAIGTSSASLASQPVTQSAPSSGGGSAPPAPVAVLPDPQSWTQPVPNQLSLDGTGIIVSDNGVSTVVVTPTADLRGIKAQAGDWSISLNVSHNLSDAAAQVGSKLQVLAGESIDLTGNGLGANSTVKVWFCSTPILLGTIVTDSKGSFTASVRIPLGLVSGAHVIILQSVGSNLKVQNEQLPVILRQPLTRTLALAFAKLSPVLSKSTKANLNTFAADLSNFERATISATCSGIKTSSRLLVTKLCDSTISYLKSALKTKRVTAVFAATSTTNKAQRSLGLVMISASGLSK